MTSKQLVNHLCYEYGTKNYNEEKLKATLELKKDLEVLEIIKKYWNIEINNLHIYISYKETSPMGILPIEETNMVKEWLENE